jgi:DNA-directed RNA polymerase subunit RPC12/RpoP
MKQIKDKKELMDNDTQYQDDMKKLVEDGYIKEDGFPLKCWKCKSNDLKFTSHYDDNTMVEKAVACNNCGSDVALWSYGHWI